MFVRVETFFLALTCIFVCSKNSWFVSCRQDTFQNSLAGNSNDLILDMFLTAGANCCTVLRSTTGRVPVHFIGDNFVYRKNPNIDALLRAQHKKSFTFASVFVILEQKSFFFSILNSEYVPYI